MKIVCLTENELLEISGGKVGDAAYIIGYASVVSTCLIIAPAFTISRLVSNLF